MTLSKTFFLFLMMTYADHINILCASYKLKTAAAKELLNKGFDDDMQIMHYLHSHKEAESARAEYLQFFNRCVRMNLDLDNEI